MEIISSSGERLSEERTRLGLSQSETAQVAKDLGVPGATRQSQARYEKGQATPSAAYMSAVATVGFDVLYILTGERRATTPQLAPDEEALLKHYRQLDPGAKQILLSTCNLFAGQSAAPSSGISVSGTGNRVAGRDYNEG